jgi:L-seryl-tRNA(Ser) seleniumtransferase
LPDDADGKNQRMRALPPVQRLLERAEADPALGAHPRAARTAAARAVLKQARGRLAEGDAPPSEAALLQAMSDILRDRTVTGLRRVINATGILLHTNLGRAPMAEVAALAAAEAARGYCDLEFDLANGARGARGAAVEALLCEVTGAEAALAVNNAAAAVLLALSALAGADGGEVIVSRGELVEIGGGFRIPDVIAQGGARLVEVGTTNRTRLSDYASAIGPATRVLLKVHQSNYRVVGFTAEAGLDELAALARAHGLLVLHDLGGGALIDLDGLGAPGEPTVAQSLAAGADLVAFSGDKLMGGPQAGLIVGRAAALAPLRRHPLLRAVRLDKMSLAALEATLRLYSDPDRARADIPMLARLGQGPERLRARAQALLDVLGADLASATAARVEPSQAYAGGGALPGRGLASFALTLAAPDGDVEGLAGRLRLGEPAVVTRIAHDRLVIDLLAIGEDEAAPLAEALRRALAP